MSSLPIQLICFAARGVLQPLIPGDVSSSLWEYLWGNFPGLCSYSEYERP